MYDVLQVTDYIINYTNYYHYSMSNLRLQKVLFYIQAEYLVTYDKPLFNDDFSAWDFGAVLPKVYYHYQIYGANNIPVLYPTLCNNHIILKDKLLINDMIETCNKYSTPQLVEINQHQQPWYDAYYNSNTHIVLKQDIKEYFQEP